MNALLKLLLLLLAAFVVAAETDAISWRYKHAMSVLMDIDMKMIVRQKRQSLNSIDAASVVSEPSSRVANEAVLDTARSCAKKCEILLSKSIMNETQSNAIESPFSILKKGFDVSTLDIVCQKFNESETCFADCDQPSSSLGVYQLICGERKQEFIDHLPCYQTKSSESKEDFERTCGGPGVVFSALFSNPAATTAQDIGRVLETMRPMCSFLKCAVDYTANALNKRCKDDPTAGAFFREIGVAGARTALGALEDFDAAQKTHLLPQECSEIINNSEGAAAKARQLSSRKWPGKESQQTAPSIVAGHRFKSNKQAAAPLVQSESKAAGEAANDQQTLASAFLDTSTTGSEVNGEPVDSTSTTKSADLGEATTQSAPAAPEKKATDGEENETGESLVNKIKALLGQAKEQPAAAKAEESIAKVDVLKEEVVAKTVNGEVTKEVVSETKETVAIQSGPSAANSETVDSEPSVEELQKTVLRKQLNVLARTEAQLELEMKKLQLEIDLLQKKATETPRDG
uniref:Chondroitin proteoglycan 4 domain-containing protein n=1 Tax=Plectus sambesii TaxID=2011161 RepID=A0A914WJJ0_9BILA